MFSGEIVFKNNHFYYYYYENIFLAAHIFSEGCKLYEFETTQIIL